jgi:hypothetical protein
MSVGRAGLICLLGGLWLAACGGDDAVEKGVLDAGPGDPGGPGGSTPGGGTPGGGDTGGNPGGTAGTCPGLPAVTDYAAAGPFDVKVISDAGPTGRYYLFRPDATLGKDDFKHPIAVWAMVFPRLRTSTRSY